VAVEPLCVAAPSVPHDTTHSGPTQFVTVQPDAGHVTWHSAVPMQSTSQLAVVLHSTWQI
jgi:hypothetical protein